MGSTVDEGWSGELLCVYLGTRAGSGGERYPGGAGVKRSSSEISCAWDKGQRGAVVPAKCEHSPSRLL